MLTLRDPQASKTLSIPATGLVIGREGGEADITVRTAAVSKKHARVYAAEGVWYIEDLRSANGTFVDNEKIAAPYQLSPGLVFDLAGYRFEVVEITDGFTEPEDPAASTLTGPAGATLTGGGLGVGVPPTAKSAPKVAGRPAPRRASADRAAVPTAPQRGSMMPMPATHVGPEPEPRQEEPAPEAPAAEEPQPPPMDEEPQEPQLSAPEEDAQTSAGGDAAAELSDPKAAAGKVMAEIPRAIAYYVLAVPKLLLNPLGTIRKSIEDQRVPPMKGLPLMAWALPGLAAFFVVGIFFTLLAGVVGVVRGGSIGTALGAVVGGVLYAAVSGVVGGLVMAFAYHPIQAAVIKLLKGTSDERSRTNYLVLLMGVSMLFAVPGGVASLGVLFPNAIVTGVLSLLSILVGLYANVIAFVAVYRWLTYFNVHKVVPKVVLGLGALVVLLSVLSAGGALVGTVKAIVAAVRSPGTTAVAKADADPDTDTDTGAKPLDPEALKKAGVDPKAVEEAQKLVAKTPEADKPPAEPAKEPAAEPVKVAEAKAPAKEPEPKIEDEPAPPVKQPAAEAPAKAVPPAPTAEPAPKVAAPEPSTDSPYQKYVSKRDWVEKTIAADPTVLTRDRDLLRSFRALHDKERDVRKKMFGRAGLPADDVVGRRLLEAETFKQTNGLVDDVYSRMHR